MESRFLLRKMAGTVLALLLLTSLAALAQPQVGSFGFGLIVPEPTGFTVKGSLGGNNAWDAAIGKSWFGNIRIHGDYLWNIDAFNSREVGLYAGLGAAIGFGRGRGVLVKGKGGEWYYYDDENATAIGVRGSFGLNLMPFSAPVELFMEAAPLIGIAPTTGVGWDVAIGIRYYP